MDTENYPEGSGMTPSRVPSASPDPAKGFVIALIVCALLAPFAIPLANIVVDPFDRFGWVSIEGFNAQKPQFAPQERLAKPGVVCGMKPSSVVLGTSRVEVGIDPRHPGWGSAGSTYNLAMAGSGLKELDLTLRHTAHASPRLRLALVGLDFLMFNAHREAVVFGTEVLGFDQQRLMLSPTDSCWRSFIHDANLVLGIDGLAYDYATIAGQIPESDRGDMAQITKWTTLYDRYGFRGDFYDVLNPLILRIGHRSIFDGASGNLASQEYYYATRIWRPAPEQRYCFEREGQPNTMATFREMLDFARRSGIDVKFFINPIHARMLIARREAGIWPQYEEWKRGLVRTLEAESRTSGASPFQLWDFSGINSVTTEHIPKLGELTEMQWWWEPSHYRKGAGDLMLDRMLDYRAPSRTVPDDFGLSLTPDNIESWIVKTRDGLRSYMLREPQEAEIVRARLAPVMGEAEGSNCGYDVQAVMEGSRALRRDDREGAEVAFARAVAIHKADRHHYAMLGVPFREKGFAGLLALARAGKEVAPHLSDWIAYQNRGNERVGQGNLEGAVEDYSQAIRLGPPNAALNYLRGTTRLRLDQFALAAQDFEAGLKLDPSNATLKQLLEQARVGAEEQQYGPARTDANFSPRLASWEAYQTRGNERLAQGNLEEAAEDFSQAIRVGPPNTALFFLRGTTRLRLEQFAQAAQDFEAGLKLDPSNATLKQLLEQARVGADKQTDLPPL